MKSVFPPNYKKNLKLKNSRELFAETLEKKCRICFNEYNSVSAIQILTASVLNLFIMSEDLSNTRGVAAPFV